MDKNDVGTVAAKMVEATRAFVARAEAALVKRIVSLEAQVAATPAGPKGEAGERGEPGEKGDIGSPGEPAADGKDGRDGRDGKDGADGRDGKDGEAGRDAAQLDVLPSIDEARSYQRGTWASHNGGLIRAARQTDAVNDGSIVEAGWAVMVEGVAALVVTQGDDPREITVASMLTSGAKATAQFRVPMLLYHGVWREGEFERGDVTTWAGSSWHCEKTTSDKPSSSDAWKLMVKRGQDGKDANGGDPSPSGVARLK